MGGGPAYMGSGKQRGWRGLVGCGVITLVVLIVAVFLAAYFIPTLICGTGHAGCPGPIPPGSGIRASGS